MQRKPITPYSPPPKAAVNVLSLGRLLPVVGLLLAGCASIEAPTPMPEMRTALERSLETPVPRPLPEAVRTALLQEPAGAAPPVPQKDEPRFDLNVHNASAQQVFLGIAAGSGYSMVLHPEVNGQITVSLRSVTLPEAMAVLRDLYGFDYRIEGRRVTVLPMAPQTRFYTVTYPGAVRQGRSEMRVMGGSLTSPGTDAVSGQNTPSVGQQESSRVITSNLADLWRELQQSVGLILGCDPAAAPPQPAGGETQTALGLQCPGGRSVLVNPQSGLLAVRALPAEHAQVRDYLRTLRARVERQVMIEAKILEVTLNEGAQAGINWAWFSADNTLAKGADAGAIPLAAPLAGGSLGNLLGGGLAGSSGALAPNGAHAGLYGLALQTNNFAALLEFLKTQGQVQVLSSPRVAALNNQKAVLKVGTDDFYVTGITTTTNTGGGGTTTSPTLTLQPFFSGISLDVTPHIDETGHIMLHVRPAVSSVSTVTRDIDLGTLGTYRLPLAASSVSETDTMVRLLDGQIAAIGGLMRVESRDAESGVPLLADLPGLGGLFRNSLSARQKRELVILLKPTLIYEPQDWIEGQQEIRARFDAYR